jgi:hypothetical protein
MNRKQLRKISDDYNRAFRTVMDAWFAAGAPARRPPVVPPFPEVLRGLTCGAKTRAGTPCKGTRLWGNLRCKLHGGRSTGPTTEEGKARAALNGLVPKKKRTP